MTALNRKAWDGRRRPKLMGDLIREWVKDKRRRVAYRIARLRARTSS